MQKCKVCKLDFENQGDYEMHRIAHILKDILVQISIMNKYFKLSVDATLKALQEPAKPS